MIQKRLVMDRNKKKKPQMVDAWTQTSDKEEEPKKDFKKSGSFGSASVLRQSSKESLALALSATPRHPTSSLHRFEAKPDTGRIKLG